MLEILWGNGRFTPVATPMDNTKNIHDMHIIWVKCSSEDIPPKMDFKSQAKVYVTRK